MSMPTAIAMMMPVVMFCQAVPTEWRLRTFCTTVMIVAPMSVAITLPWPPKRLAPPITAAAIACNSTPSP